MFLHKSLYNTEFLSDKKLNLLKNNIINISQFISLIDISDPYTIIGPAIVAKNKIQQFMAQWKAEQLEITNFSNNNLKITQQDIIAKLQEIIQIFPQVSSIAYQFKNKLNSTNVCPMCEKNKFILLILSNIRYLYNDGRDLKQLKVFIQQLLFKYYPMSNKVINANNLSNLDIQWIKPDQLVALGNDLIQGLNSCFDCAKKHISRAKAFYQQWLQGYPDHSSLMYKQFVTTNEVLQKGYALFWDSLAQLDMSSSQLVGNIIQLSSSARIEIIQLANKIRIARILFQEDSTQIPKWDQLRLQIQKLQNKINKVK